MNTTLSLLLGTSADLEVVPDSVEANNITLEAMSTYRQIAVAFAAFYMWDFLLTISDEVQLMWTPGFKLPKILYFFNRYFSLLSGIMQAYFVVANHYTYEICQAWYKASSGAVFLVCWNGGGIMLCHINAIYQTRKAVTRTVTALYVLTVLYSLGMGAIASEILIKTSEPQLRVCLMYPVKTSVTDYTSIPMLVTDIVFMALIGYKTITYYRQSLNKQWIGAALMKRLGQGSVMCYISVCLAELLAMLLQLLAPYLIFMAASIFFSVYAMAINRLVLGMNKTGKRKLHVVKVREQV